jgi:hypothetical protein
MGIANAKLRQDVRRSQSVGNSSMMLPQAAKPSCLSPATRRGLEASIAAIGFPSSLRHEGDSQGQGQHFSLHKNGAQPAARAGGGSYASAVRIGATAEESESTITDQMLIGSLQSDLFEALSSNDNNYMYGPSDSSCIIQRPLRSLSEPVIQLPGSMLGPDYFQNHILNRMGVGALGGAHNPQSPNKFSYDVSPMPTRSPVVSSQASTPRSPFGVAWLSTPPSEMENVGTFPPLSLPASTSMTGLSDSVSAPQTQRQSYQQGGFDSELGDYFRNHSITSQQRVHRDESIIPSPSAWASMLMTPAMNPPSNSQRDQQYFNTQMPPQRSTQGSLGQSTEGQEQGHDFPYLYEQHHQQLQQQQLQQQLQQQQLQLQQQQRQQNQNQNQNQYFQQHSVYGLEKSIQNALNDESDSPFVSQGRSRSQSQCHTPWGTYGPGSLMGSGAGSRSGSILEGAGSASLTSGVTDRDELFLFEDSRLDIEAPEFEPQSHTQSQLLSHSQAQNVSLTPTYRAW